MFKFLTLQLQLSQLQVSYIATTTFTATSFEVSYIGTTIYCLLSSAVLPTVQLTYGFTAIPEISPALGSRIVLQ